MLITEKSIGTIRYEHRMAAGGLPITALPQYDITRGGHLRERDILDLLVDLGHMTRPEYWDCLTCQHVFIDVGLRCHYCKKCSANEDRWTGEIYENLGGGEVEDIDAGNL
jgi:hypothetical protein